MGLLDDAADALKPSEDAPPPEPTAASATAVAARDAEVMVDGETVSVESPETKQSGEEGSWLVAQGKYGIPRGPDALEHRQLVQTAAMQSIVNGIVDQLLGGDLAFEDRDDRTEDLSDAELNLTDDLRDLLRDVLTGPHLSGQSLDDLVTAAVEDMLGPGNAYWQLLPSEDGSVPVAALSNLDPITIRRNVDDHGVPKEPPYWQATNAFGSGGVSTIGAVDPIPLESEQVFEFSYPRGHRSWTFYPKSPAWQLKEWLEILANSTTHHNRFYSDNEIPPGLIQIVNASGNTVEDVKKKIQDSSGDPRDVPIIGGEGGAQWLDMGGTAVNLNVVSEQKWFFFLCLGSLGLGKAEVGMIEDVNRSNGEIEATRVFKRVTGPFRSQFEAAFKHIARQFDAYNDLGEPFTPTLKFTDPREERAREQRLREMYQSGGLTLRQYVRRRGDEALAEDEDKFTVEIDGEAINYGDHPLWVAKRLMAAAGEGVPLDPDAEDGDGEQALGTTPAEATPRHNGS